MKAALYAGLAVGAYVAIAVVVEIVLRSHGMERPIIGGALWPLRLIKLLLGGG